MARTNILPMLALGAALALGACETTVESQRLPDITFAHLQPFEVDVARIEVINRFVPPLAAPNVEHRLPAAPADALRQWARDRLKAVGETGSLRLVIEDASATETALGRDKSLKGKFTKQQSHRYDFNVRATLSLTDADGIERGAASASASRSVTVREDASLNARERTWFNAVDRLMGDFNGAMETSMRRYLARWLR